MLTTVTTKLVMADSTLTEHRKFYLIFEGTCSSYHLRFGLSFDMENPLDCHEMDVINGLSGVKQLHWQSQVVGRAFRSIININEISRNKFEIETKAVGHATEDLFLVVDSGLELMTHEKAMNVITEQNAN